MAIPVQVWAPFDERSPVDEVWARDLQRAQSERQGEIRVWLYPPNRHPDMIRIIRWHTVQQGVNLNECMVPSERLNCLTVYHVDESRRVYPVLVSPHASFSVLSEALYARWISAIPELHYAPREFTWVVPHMVNEHVTMEPATISTTPGAVLPATVSAIADDVAHLHLQWPPPGMRLPSMVSPETESHGIYGRLRRKVIGGDNGDLDVVVTEYDPELVALPLRLKWATPFDAMFPLGGGNDLLAHQAVMRWCIEHLADNARPLALRIIENWVQRLGGECESTLEQAWLLPKLNVDIEAALVDVEGRLGLSATTVDELASLPAYSAALSERLKIRRVQGWLGYFWWELSEDVRMNTAIRFCKHCGNIIRGGHADRRFCSHAESAECYRERHATVQRRTRATQQGPKSKGTSRQRKRK